MRRISESLVSLFKSMNKTHTIACSPLQFVDLVLAGSKLFMSFKWLLWSNKQVWFLDKQLLHIQTLAILKYFIGVAVLSTDLDKLFDIWCFTRSRPVQHECTQTFELGRYWLDNRSFESLCKYLFLLNRGLDTSDSVIKSSIIYMYIRHPWFLNTYRGNFVSWNYHD